ncbi:MAG: hypothetical protein NZT61_06225 [Deltaproteobacteria bacterium]|nr:hypothetical protein [Deltaproteobacteria bacterium]
MLLDELQKFKSSQPRHISDEEVILRCLDLLNRNLGNIFEYDETSLKLTYFLSSRTKDEVLTILRYLHEGLRTGGNS